MKKAQSRWYEALDYEQKVKASLSAKQYLVYSYLLSISKWNSQEREEHYYVYLKEIIVKEVCEILHISQPTWRAALDKLERLGYIFIYKEKGYILINYAKKSYAPLNIDVIKYLMSMGSCIVNGGNIVAVYSVIYKYWLFQTENHDSCEITINQLKSLFVSHRSTEITQTYKLMLAVFSSSGLIDCQIVIREKNGNPYQAYLIKNVRLDLPEEQKVEDYGSLDACNILSALEKTLDNEGC